MIAIHYLDSQWADRWINYCSKNNIDHLKVNIYSSNIISHLKTNKVSALLAQPVLSDYKTNLISRSVLYSIEKTGIKTFPNFEAFWHYNDKLSQKYLFEALEIAHAPMYVFYNKSDAYTWLSTADYPLVFKLRGGASSSNVVLLKNKQQAYSFAKKIFTSGFKPVKSVFNDFKTKARIHNKERDWLQTFMRIPDTIKNSIERKKAMPLERGYFLVQKFLPGNTYDTRVFVMGKKAIAARRFVRPNDFRASGTGSLNSDLDQSKIDRHAVALAFRASKKIGSYSMAYDIIYNENSEPVIIEMSYSMPTKDDEILNIEGYWDDSLVFHKARVRCEDFILQNLLDHSDLD